MKLKTFVGVPTAPLWALTVSFCSFVTALFLASRPCRLYTAPEVVLYPAMCGPGRCACAQHATSVTGVAAFEL